MITNEEKIEMILNKLNNLEEALIQELDLLTNQG
jgi:hypothetical protein